MKIPALSPRVQAFAPAASPQDLAELERQIASLEAEAAHNETVIRELDAGLLASLKRALEAKIVIPPELLPPPPPMCWLASIVEHRDGILSRLLKGSTEDPADIGYAEMKQAARERDPDYYSVQTVAGRQEIRARFATALAGGVVREAVRRHTDDLTLTFRHQPEPPAGGWYDDPYSDWSAMLADAHARFTPGHYLELRFKRLGASGRIVSNFHPLRLEAKAAA